MSTSTVIPLGWIAQSISLDVVMSTKVTELKNRRGKSEHAVVCVCLPVSRRECEIQSWDNQVGTGRETLTCICKKPYSAKAVQKAC